MLTKDEWKKNVEIAAAHKHGEDNASFYVWRRRLAGPWGVVFAVAGFAGLVVWLTHHVHLPDAGFGANSIPAVFWILGVSLIIGTGWAFRPTAAIRPAASTLIRAGIAALLWLGYIAYGIGLILS